MARILVATTRPGSTSSTWLIPPPPRRFTMLSLIRVMFVTWCCSHLGVAWSSSSSSSSSSAAAPAVIPVTVISGFLGSGKTTLLKYLLEHNPQGLKIALVVNDFASVNIDSQLLAPPSSLSSSRSLAGLVELQNGCACCSKSQELLSSLAELVTLSDMRDPDQAFDHIVVELSGVADPRAIRSKWQEAMLYNMPLVTERLRLDTLCTVVDCSTFLEYMSGSSSDKMATVQEAPELYSRPNDGLLSAKGITDDDKNNNDDDDENALSNLLEALSSNDGSSGNTNSVAGLLAAQIETADVILLNKVDLAKDSTGVAAPTDSAQNGVVKQIRDMVGALAGPRATVLETNYGQIDDVSQILGHAKGQGVVLAGLVDDHHDSVQAATATAATFVQTLLKTTTTHSHDSHDHDHDEAIAATATTNHNDLSTWKDPTGTRTSHAHSHSHSHSQSSNDPDCTDISHDYEHSHSHACDDPDCMDPSHSATAPATSSLHAGIGTFVYKARRPFHPKRLTNFLGRLGISRGLPHETTTDKHQLLQDKDYHAVQYTLQNILRSKGFAWLANTNRLATYWSHVGKAFELQVFGSWWATLPRRQWPPDLVETILQDFDNVDHDDDHDHDQAAAATSSMLSVGDRRQEVVLIGWGLQDPVRQGQLQQELDQCLLNSDEYQTFQALRFDEAALKAAFPCALSAHMVNF